MSEKKKFQTHVLLNTVIILTKLV